MNGQRNNPVRTKPFKAFCDFLGGLFHFVLAHEFSFSYYKYWVLKGRHHTLIGWKSATRVFFNIMYDLSNHLKRKITQMPALEVEYKNVALRVELGSEQSAELFINNIQRMQASLTVPSGTLRLSSSVQTDYEWHEFIDVIITFSEKKITISLRASSAEIACKTYPAQTDNGK
jgi:hypothetical protein